MKVKVRRISVREIIIDVPDDMPQPVHAALELASHIDFYTCETLTGVKFTAENTKHSVVSIEIDVTRRPKPTGGRYKHLKPFAVVAERGDETWVVRSYPTRDSMLAGLRDLWQTITYADAPEKAPTLVPVEWS